MDDLVDEWIADVLTFVRNSWGNQAAMVESDEFNYVHEWSVGDLLLWDNRCTQHARRDFDPDERRLMRRFAVIGEEGGPRHEVDENSRVLV